MNYVAAGGWDGEDGQKSLTGVFSIVPQIRECPKLEYPGHINRKRVPNSVPGPVHYLAFSFLDDSSRLPEFSENTPGGGAYFRKYVLLLFFQWKNRPRGV